MTDYDLVGGCDLADHLAHFPVARAVQGSQDRAHPLGGSALEIHIMEPGEEVGQRGPLDLTPG